MPTRSHSNGPCGCLVALVIIIGVAWLLIWRTFGWDVVIRVFAVGYVLNYLQRLLFETHGRGARVSVLSVATTLFGAGAAMWLMFFWDVRWWIRWPLACILAAPLMAIANAAHRADVVRAQRRRDTEATALAQNVLAGKPVQPFILYLRPFVTTDRLGAVALPPQSDTIMGPPVHLDFETLLVRSVRATILVIKCGHSGDLVEGAARVAVSDDTWRETVTALARHAEFIVMVPLSTPGTMWELKWVTDHGLIGKVLFVMPEFPYEAPPGVQYARPSDRIFENVGVLSFDPSKHTLDLVKAWSEATHAAAELGLEFPSLAVAGALFTIEPTTGRVGGIVPLGLTTSAQPMTYLRASVEHLALLPKSGSPADFLEDLERLTFGSPRSREFALLRAADGFAVWGNRAAAMKSMHKAVDAGWPDARLVWHYFEGVPAEIDERVTIGDTRAVLNYREFLRQVLADTRLAPCVPSELLGRTIYSSNRPQS